MGTAALPLGCTAQMGRIEARTQNAAWDLAAYRARAPELTGPLTLEAALDCADRYNIEVWIAAQEQQFQHELTTAARLKMLPSLIAGADVSRRSEYDASSSVSLETGKESLEPSYSAEKTGHRYDLTATWSLLDFGISYLRARQQSNRVSIAAEQERRVRQKLALEVTRAYWQAVTARDSALAAAQIEGRVWDALTKIRQQIEGKTVSPIEGLKRETRLLELQEELRRYQRTYLAAKAELATLIGLPPGTDFVLAQVDLDGPVQTAACDVAELEEAALHNRPELFEKDREQAVTRDEARIALLELFPSPAVYWRFDFDRNNYLAFNEWNTFGLRATWDLLAIPQKLQRGAALQLQSELIAKRRTAIAVAILTQLHLALIDRAEAAGRLRSARRIAQKRHDLVTAYTSAVEDGKSHAGELLEQRMRYVQARAKELAAYAGLQVADARVQNTIGLDRPVQGSGPAQAPAAAATPAPTGLADG